MKYRLVLFAAFLTGLPGLTGVPVPCVAQDAESFPAIPLPLELHDGDTFVFLGDSITHQRLYTQYVETFFYTRFPDRRIRFHNAGVGGAQAWDALQRLQQDVLSLKPRAVSILLGMNDGRYQPFDRAIFTRYQTDMTELIQQIRAAGAAPVLMSPTMFDARAAEMGTRRHDSARLEEYNSVLAYYGRWLQHRAVTDGLAWVDLFSPLNRITVRHRREDPQFTLIRDAVHPDPPGQVVMALAMIEQMTAPGPLSRIVVRVSDRPQAGRRTVGGEISGLKVTEEGVRFVWAADGLPWVLPKSAQPGMKMTQAARRVSRETLCVIGLSPGRYDVLIDDIVVATVPAERLVQGLELQSQTKTPQYQQALRVALLNEEKNRGPVGKLRDAWREFQTYARLKRDTATTAADENTKKVLRTLEERMQTLEDRVRAVQQDIRRFEDEIEQTRQPPVRHYFIRRTDAS